MKGIIYNVFENYCDESFGEGTFDSLVEKYFPDIMDPFVGPSTYDDAILVTLITNISSQYKIEVEPLVRGFGKYLFSVLSEKYPDFVTPYKHPKDFIKTIHDVIHVEVRKLFPEAVTPEFYYSNETANSITLKYVSKRNLFALVEGLIDGVSEYYNTKIKIDRVEESVDKNYAVFDLAF